MKVTAILSERRQQNVRARTLMRRVAGRLRPTGQLLEKSSSLGTWESVELSAESFDARLILSADSS